MHGHHTLVAVLAAPDPYFANIERSIAPPPALHAVHFIAQRVTREVAGESQFTQVPTRERTLQRFSDAVMS